MRRWRLLLGLGVIVSALSFLPSSVLACGAACYDPNYPLGFVHFWYLQDGWYYYGDYEFDCNGNVTKFCPSSAFVNRTQVPQDTTPQNLSYNCGCGGTNPDGDKEWGRCGDGGCPGGAGSAGGGGGSGVGVGLPPDPRGVGQPINLTTGNMYHAQTDLSIPGQRGGLAFVRTYNSQAAYSNHGALGYGWSHTYEMRLEAVSSGVSGAAESLSARSIASRFAWRTGGAPILSG